MGNLPRPIRGANRPGETLATWQHTRRNTTNPIEMRATRTRGRVVIEERRGRRWQTTRDVPADARTVRALRRQGRR